MSVYHYIGCEKCQEDVAFLRDGMTGFGWMGGADTEVPQFMEKHHRMGHSEHLRIYSEFDHRADDFTTFDPAAPYEVEP